MYPVSPAVDKIPTAAIIASILRNLLFSIAVTSLHVSDRSTEKQYEHYNGNNKNSANYAEYDTAGFKQFFLFRILCTAFFEFRKKYEKEYNNCCGDSKYCNNAENVKHYPYECLHITLPLNTPQTAAKRPHDD